MINDLQIKLDKQSMINYNNLNKMKKYNSRIKSLEL
jgi:hypothetical protein